MVLNMFPFKKLTALLAINLTLMSAVPARAETDTSTVGTFSLLQKGDKAPFDGVLYDPTANAILLTEGEAVEDKYKLKLNYELDKLKAEHKLELDNVNISLKTSQDSSKIIIDAKDKEIEKLRDMSLHSSDYTWLYIGGGFLAGIALTALAVWGAGQLRD